MNFKLYEKVKIKKDTFFPFRKIMVKAGEVGTIIDIYKSTIDENKLGYVVELPKYDQTDPTFVFSEDSIEKIK